MCLNKKITINSSQFKNLIEQKELPYQDGFLQFHDGDLIFNADGDIFYNKEVNLDFFKYDNDNNYDVDDIKKMVCRHLNLTSSEVIFKNSGTGYFDFIVKFDGKNSSNIFVCDFTTAVQNMSEILPNCPKYNCDDLTVGIYRKLGKTSYYFRWFNDI